MHVYVYDSFLNQNKYNNTLAKIETRITDLGLNGKICRLGVIKNYQDTILSEIKRGAKTIIAVGNDETINQIINSVGKFDIPMGIIPIGNENNLIANALGINCDLTACDVLSARRIEKLNLAEANNVFFLSEASITTKNTVIEINKNYSIEILEAGEVKIINLPLNKTSLPRNAKFNPQDNKLELYIKTKTSKKFLKKITGESVFSFDKLSIENKNHCLIIDNSTKLNMPVSINLSNNFINIIVGKERSF